MSAPRTYVCAQCGGTFEYDPAWTHEDAVRESLKTFGKDAVEAFATNKNGERLRRVLSSEFRAGKKATGETKWIAVLNRNRTVTWPFASISKIAASTSRPTPRTLSRGNISRSARQWIGSRSRRSDTPSSPASRRISLKSRARHSRTLATRARMRRTSGIRPLIARVQRHRIKVTEHPTQGQDYIVTPVTEPTPLSAEDMVLLRSHFDDHDESRHWCRLCDPKHGVYMQRMFATIDEERTRADAAKELVRVLQEALRELTDPETIGDQCEVVGSLCQTHMYFPPCPIPEWRALAVFDSSLEPGEIRIEAKQ